MWHYNYLITNVYNASDGVKLLFSLSEYQQKHLLWHRLLQPALAGTERTTRYTSGIDNDPIAIIQMRKDAIIDILLAHAGTNLVQSVDESWEASVQLLKELLLLVYLHVITRDNFLFGGFQLLAP